MKLQTLYDVVNDAHLSLLNDSAMASTTAMEALDRLAMLLIEEAEDIDKFLMVK